MKKESKKEYRGSSNISRTMKETKINSKIFKKMNSNNKISIYQIIWINYK